MLDRVMPDRVVCLGSCFCVWVSSLSESDFTHDSRVFHGCVRADLLLRAAWAPLQLQECSLSSLPSPHWLLNTGPDTSHSEPLCGR